MKYYKKAYNKIRVDPNSIHANVSLVQCGVAAAHQMLGAVSARIAASGSGSMSALEEIGYWKNYRDEEISEPICEDSRGGKSMGATRE